jgi:putative Ca2+/H+ antiporter (TMEM165/GDT1 family)
MDGFLLALLLVFALALGGRDQWLAARWGQGAGRGKAAVLVVVSGCAVMSAAAMAWIGAEFASLLPRRAAQMLVAFALGFAAVELALPMRRADPAREPTRSLGAIAIVVLARQIGDGARFAVFALAAWAALPLAAGLGGALGGAAAVALGWSAGEASLARWPLRAIRLALAGCLFIAALFVGLNARFGAS